MRSADSPVIRILVADDHEVVRVGVTAILHRHEDLKVVAEAENGRQAVERCRLHVPDIVVIDLNMPVMDGVEATGLISRETPDVKIIVFSVAEGDENVFRALQAGAKAYILKDTIAKDLVDTVRAVHAGERRISPEPAVQLAKRASLNELTAREIDVLKLMVAGRSNKEIAAALNLTEGTVKWYVSVILDKLQVSDRTQAVTTAIQRGFVRLSGGS